MKKGAFDFSFVFKIMASGLDRKGADHACNNLFVIAAIGSVKITFEVKMVFTYCFFYYF